MEKYLGKKNKKEKIQKIFLINLQLFLLQIHETTTSAKTKGAINYIFQNTKKR